MTQHLLHYVAHTRNHLKTNQMTTLNMKIDNGNLIFEGIQSNSLFLTHIYRERKKKENSLYNVLIHTHPHTYILILKHKYKKGKIFKMFLKFLFLFVL